MVIQIIAIIWIDETNWTISWLVGDPQCFTNLWLHTICNPLALKAKCANAPPPPFILKSVFSTFIMFKLWVFVSSAVHLLIRSLWLYSAGKREDEVDSAITCKPGKESKFWFKLLKSYVTPPYSWQNRWWFLNLST